MQVRSRFGIAVIVGFVAIALVILLVYLSTEDNGEGKPSSSLSERRPGDGRDLTLENIYLPEPPPITRRLRLVYSESSNRGPLGYGPAIKEDVEEYARWAGIAIVSEDADADATLRIKVEGKFDSAYTGLPPGWVGYKIVGPGAFKKTFFLKVDLEILQGAKRFRVSRKGGGLINSLSRILHEALDVREILPLMHFVSKPRHSLDAVGRLEVVTLPDFSPAFLAVLGDEKGTEFVEGWTWRQHPRTKHRAYVPKRLVNLADELLAEDARVSDAAWRKIKSDFGDPRLRETLTEALKKTQNDHRESLAAFFAPPRSLEPLIKLLNRAPWKGSRDLVAKVLGNIGNRRAVAPLYEAAKAEYAKKRNTDGLRFWQAVIKALGSIPGNDATLALCSILDMITKRGRTYCVSDRLNVVIEQLIGRADTVAIDPLLKLFNGPSYQAGCAMEALAVYDDPRVIKAIAERLGDRSLSFRAEVILSKKGKLCVTELVRVLKEGNSLGRRKAAHALGLVKDPTAVPALQEALNDEDLNVRREASRSLHILDHNYRRGFGRR